MLKKLILLVTLVATVISLIVGSGVASADDPELSRSAKRDLNSWLFLRPLEGIISELPIVGNLFKIGRLAYSFDTSFKQDNLQSPTAALDRSGFLYDLGSFFLGNPSPGFFRPIHKLYFNMSLDLLERPTSQIAKLNTLKEKAVTNLSNIERSNKAVSDKLNKLNRELSLLKIKESGLFSPFRNKDPFNQQNKYRLPSWIPIPRPIPYKDPFNQQNKYRPSWTPIPRPIPYRR